MSDSFFLSTLLDTELELKNLNTSDGTAAVLILPEIQIAPYTAGTPCQKPWPETSFTVLLLTEMQRFHKLVLFISYPEMNEVSFIGK